MKVALVQCPVWWTVDPPLGLAQMAGCLKAAGHDVCVFDLNILSWKERSSRYATLWLWEHSHFWNVPELVDRFLEDNRRFFEKAVEEILATDARVIGFSVNYGSQLLSRKVAELIKSADPRRQIVLGGQYFFLGNTARETLERVHTVDAVPAQARGDQNRPAVDAVVRDNADQVFPRLVDDVARTGRPAVRPGVVVRTDEGHVRDGGRALAPRNLDRIPFADFTGFPMDLYSDTTRIPMAASRGCVWACRFCSTREFWTGYSHMSGDRIFAEVSHQRRLFPSRNHVEFYDITANGRPETLARFSDLMINARLGREPAGAAGWKINAILRPEMTLQLLRKMRAAGCRAVIYGVESGSPKVLKRMNKNYTLAVAEDVLRNTHLAGIHTTANFMVGFPGETEEDFQLTLDFIKRNRRFLDRAYPSATFTSLEEHSFLTEHPAEFGVKVEPNGSHNLYWETTDGTNTFPVRLERYRRFRETAERLGIEAARGLNGDLDQETARSLAAYYRHQGEADLARTAYRKYLEKDPQNQAIRIELKALESMVPPLASEPQVPLLAERQVVG